MGAGELQINAWVGGESGSPSAKVGASSGDWAIRTSDTFDPRPDMPAEEPADLRDWRTDHRVGWGLILPVTRSATNAEMGNAEDLDPAIKDLLASRPGSPIFRYVRARGSSHLVRYDPGGRAQRLGTGGRGLPKYLLIVGSPQQVPWRLQYQLNGTRCVGRLDLPPEGLRNYVDALLGGWTTADVDPNGIVLWSVEHDEADITWLMRHGIAEPLKKAYEGIRTSEGIKELSVNMLRPDAATVQELVSMLRSARPALLVTTSHGDTPIHSTKPTFRASVGQPIDRAGDPVRAADVHGAGEMYGAIWYAHACCSAGTDDSGLYDDVTDPGTDIRNVLDGLASLGATTAPLPTALLGSAKPLRAFVGHVEPTFNWTLRDPETGELLTNDLRDSLCDGLYRERREPIGMAMTKYFDPLSDLWSKWDNEARLGSRGDAGAKAAQHRALIARLSALDRQSTVILGDPTVTLAT